MIIDYYGAMKVARTLADQKNLRIVYEDKMAPRTDGRTIWLPRPSPLWTEEQWATWWYLLYHEEGHCEPAARDAFEAVKEKGIKPQSPLFVVCNVLEDYRQEKFGIDQYAGKREAMEIGYSIATRDLIARASEIPEDKRTPQVMALSAWDTGNRVDWLPGLSGYVPQMERLCSEEATKYLDKLKDGYTDALNEAKTGKDIVKLAEKILKEVFKFTEEQMQQQYGPTEGKGKGNKKGEGKEKAEREGDAKISWEDLVMHDHGGEGTESKFKLDIDYETYKATKNYSPHTDKTNIIMEDLPKPDGASYYRNAFKLNTTPIKKAIQRYLQVITRDKYRFGLKKGKLQNSNLYRVVLKGCKEYSKRVFKKREENKCLDVAVLLLNDASGSMGDSKLVNTVDATWQIADTLQSLHVPTEIAFFSELSSSDNRYMVVKNFNKNINVEDYREGCIYASQHMANNADPDSVLVAYHRLLKRPEKRKLLIVLSDGQPVCFRPGDVFNFHKLIVDKIEKEKKVEIYGIGIESDAVKYFYSKYCVLRNSSELEEQLFNLIKGYIVEDSF